MFFGSTHIAFSSVSIVSRISEVNQRTIVIAQSLGLFAASFSDLPTEFKFFRLLPPE